ncbi:DUF305 domain-containing protein [Streptomyces durbertensis]|uniref:DUF305 domain-containing protein n=1 Tax=Streptomyces durbertensis TaxID=2448886 RepID=A0ABR6EE72_9ACTN|nr:DUF305 domain-containing protein [Streptomyces durbertensis]MBB1243627.1 DUF305 domain-containing protein [Streptomyces durbertensis]
MHSHRPLVRRVAGAVTVLTALAALTACGDNGSDSPGHSGGHGNGSPSAPASPGKHNSADVAFAQGMIPHHRQALEMAELAADRAGSAEVRKLVKEIEDAQEPEIRKMSGWLRSWGEPVPRPDDAGGHAGHDMPGMMSSEEMGKLEKSSGRAFDTAFLELMIKHHEGAVEMAKTEQDEGAYQPAKDMAEEIERSQSEEITRMRELLDR